MIPDVDLQFVVKASDECLFQVYHPLARALGLTTLPATVTPNNFDNVTSQPNYCPTPATANQWEVSELYRALVGQQVNTRQAIPDKGAAVILTNPIRLISIAKYGLAFNRKTDPSVQIESVLLRSIIKLNSPQPDNSNYELTLQYNYPGSKYGRPQSDVKRIICAGSTAVKACF